MKIHVVIGDKVKTDTVIASGRVFAKKIEVDIAKELGIRNEKAREYLLCLHGEMVVKDEKIAHKSGSISQKEKTVLAPRSGMVDLARISQGFLDIIGPGQESAKESGVDGKVSAIVKDKFIEIETNVIKIKLFCVTGRTIQGDITFLDENKPNYGIGPNLLNTIVILDKPDYIGHIRELALFRVKGVVLSSIASAFFTKDVKSILSGVTLGIVDGYGNFRFDEQMKNLLKMNEVKLAKIDNKNDELILTSYSKNRESISNDIQLETLKQGKKVQIFDMLNWGEFGKVVDFDEKESIVRVMLETGGKVISTSLLNVVIVK